MKVTRKIVLSVIGAAGLAVASTAALAHPGWQGGMGRGMGPGMMAGMGPCAAAAADATTACPMAGAGAMRGAAGCAFTGAGAGAGAPQALMTDDERQAFFDKMRTAKTPEERQKLALENRTEMQKRAAERGIELPPMRGPGMGYGPGPGGMRQGGGPGMSYGWGPGMGPMRGSTPEPTR